MRMAGLDTFHAARVGSVKFLIEQKKEANEKEFQQKNSNRETLLHVATLHNQFEVVAHLLQQGENVNYPNEESRWTPLHIAIYFGNLRTAKSLLQYKPRLDSPDEDGKLPFDVTPTRFYCTEGPTRAIVSLSSFGKNAGQLGYSTRKPIVHEPRRIKDFPGISGNDYAPGFSCASVRISICTTGSMACTKDGKVWAWGEMFYGQRPTQLAEGAWGKRKWRSVAITETHGAAVTFDRLLYVWSHSSKKSDSGQVWAKTKFQQPLKLESGYNADRVFCTPHRLYILTKGGKLYLCGRSLRDPKKLFKSPRRVKSIRIEMENLTHVAVCGRVLAVMKGNEIWQLAEGSDEFKLVRFDRADLVTLGGNFQHVNRRSDFKLCGVDISNEVGVALTMSGDVYRWDPNHLSKGGQRIQRISRAEIISTSCSRKYIWCINSRGDLFEWNLDDDFKSRKKMGHACHIVSCESHSIVIQSLRVPEFAIPRDGSMSLVQISTLKLLKSLIEPREVLPNFRAAIKMQLPFMIRFLAAVILVNASHFLPLALDFLPYDELAILEEFYFTFFRWTNPPKPRKVDMSLKEKLDKKAEEMAKNPLDKVSRKKKGANSPLVKPRRTPSSKSVSARSPTFKPGPASSPVFKPLPASSPVFKPLPAHSPVLKNQPSPGAWGRTSLVKADPGRRQAPNVTPPLHPMKKGSPVRQRDRMNPWKGPGMGMKKVPDQKRYSDRQQLNDFFLDSQASWSTVKKKPQRKKKACKSPKTSPMQSSFKTPPLSPKASPVWGPQKASLMDYMKPKKKKKSPQNSPTSKKHNWATKKQAPPKISLSNILDEEQERMKGKRVDVDSHWKQVTNVNKPEFEKLQMVEDDELLAMRLYQEELALFGLATEWNDSEFQAPLKNAEAKNKKSRKKSQSGQGKSKRKGKKEKNRDQTLSSKEDLNRKKKGNKPAQGKQGNVNSKRRKKKEKGKEAQHPDRNSTAKSGDGRKSKRMHNGKRQGIGVKGKSQSRKEKKNSIDVKYG